jgi:hypothetical protein
MGYARDEPGKVMQSHTHIHIEREIDKIGQDLHFVQEHAGPKIFDELVVVLLAVLRVMQPAVQQLQKPDARPAVRNSRRTKSFL